MASELVDKLAEATFVGIRAKAVNWESFRRSFMRVSTILQEKSDEIPSTVERCASKVQRSVTLVFRINLCMLLYENAAYPRHSFYRPQDLLSGPGRGGIDAWMVHGLEVPHAKEQRRLPGNVLKVHARPETHQLHDEDRVANERGVVKPCAQFVPAEDSIIVEPAREAREVDDAVARTAGCGELDASFVPLA